MGKYKIGDILVITTSIEKNNIGRVGTVQKIEGNYYQLSCLPNNLYKDGCLDYASGVDQIREERRRQIEQEGYDALHDRHHTPQMLCRAAIGYALHEDRSKLVSDAAANLWPWSDECWKPKDHLRNLVRAGALIAAAIDRLITKEE